VSRLSHYEHYHDEKKSFIDKLFILILFSVVSMLIVIGVYFKGIKPLVKKYQERKNIETSFLFQKKRVKKVLPKPIFKKKIIKKKKPIDLTKKPIIKKKEEEIIKPKKEKVKKIFGVKKVYSSGLGNGGSMNDAVVNKVGNTINKDFDKIKAKPKDLKGEIVSIAKISRQPVLNRNTLIKPKYTKAMTENGIEGIIKAKILIDIDGKVKKVNILNTLGYGSGKQVEKSCYKLKFKPAMEEGIPRAVWIIIKFNLQLRS